VKKTATQPAPSRDGGAGPSGTSSTNVLEELTGAAAGAGVLTAVDEGDEEAEVPDDFEYHSENEGED
jgi:26S proteasome regulatory subunit N2